VRRLTGSAARGFTLVELLTALLVLSLLALMCYRGLGAVLDAREHVRSETDKWQRVAAFLARFGRDVALAAPRPVRRAEGMAPAWLGAAPPQARLEFSRFASVGGVDAPRRVGYALNDRREIELELWSGLDVAPGVAPARHSVLSGVQSFELHYLDVSLVWNDRWPRSAADPALPRAVRLRLVLASGEEIVRIFALQS
jgi:general secretion pathway protein J